MRTELGLDRKQTGYEERKKLAEKYGIKDYTGSAKQNIELLNKIKSEKDPADAVKRMLAGEKLEDINNI
jgi:peptidoglycan L-alanyl-D-glutamate endopeptidase CwlK